MATKPLKSKSIKNLFSFHSADIKDGDEIIVDLLSHTEIDSNGCMARLGRAEVCWNAYIKIATVPSKYVNKQYIDSLEGVNINDVNCDFVDITYRHEGVCSLDDIRVFVGTIFLSYPEAETTVLAASAKLVPMTRHTRINSYGPFKDVVSAADIMTEGSIINYNFNPQLPENHIFFEQPFTSDAIQPQPAFHRPNK